MSFRVSDPQIYEFTICFTSQSPISGKLVHSQTSPAFDHYDFLLPRDQIVGLLLDNSLDVEM